MASALAWARPSALPRLCLGLAFGLALGPAFVPDLFGEVRLVEGEVHGHQSPPEVLGWALAQPLCGEFDDRVGDVLGNVPQRGGQCLQYGTDVRITRVRDGRQGGQRQVLGGLGRVGDDGHVVRAHDDRPDAEGGHVGGPAGDRQTGPLRGGPVLADDQQDGRQPVLRPQVGDVVGPARRLGRVLPTLRLDGEEEGAVLSAVQPQEGVDAALDRPRLGEVVRQDDRLDGVREGRPSTSFRRLKRWRSCRKMWCIASCGGLTMKFLGVWCREGPSGAAGAAGAGFGSAEGAVADVAVLEGCRGSPGPGAERGRGGSRSVRRWARRAAGRCRGSWGRVEVRTRWTASGVRSRSSQATTPGARCSVSAADRPGWLQEIVRVTILPASSRSRSRRRQPWVSSSRSPPAIRHAPRGSA